MKPLFFACLTVLIHTAGFSQSLVLEKINGPAGNADLSTVLGDQNGNLYAVAEDFSYYSGAIYWSQNAGSNWQKLNFTCRYLRIAPDGTLFAIKQNGIYRSTDHGQSWTLINANYSDFNSILEITPAGTLLYTDYINTLYKSVNNGTSWTQVTTPFASVKKIFPGNDGSIYAFISVGSGATEGTEVYRSTDEGQTWPLVCTSPEKIGGTGIYFQTQSGRLIVPDYSSTNFYYSDNYGSIWTLHTLYSNGGEIQATITQSPTGRLWRVTTMRRFYSDNNGTNWTDNSQAPYADPLKSIYSTPDGNFWGNFEGSLYRATDLTFQNWTFAAEGMQEPNVQQIQAVNDEDLYVATSGGLFHSTDQGANWTHFYQGPIFSDSRNYDSRFCIDQNGQVLLADGFHVWRIDPQTGSRTDITPPDNQILQGRLWTVFYLPNGTVLVGGSPAVTYISTDNGVSWSHFSSAGMMVVGLKVVTDTLVYLYPEGDGFYAYNPVLGVKQLLRLDAGQYPMLSGLDLGPAGSIHVINYHRPCVSYDFGASWACYESTADPYFVPRRMVVNAAGDIFTSGVWDGTGIYESVDGGLSWNVVYGDVNNHNTSVSTMNLSPAGYMYAAVYRKGVYRSVHSTTDQALVKGWVFNDGTIPDCDREATEPGMVQVKARLSGNGSSYIGISNIYGQYTMPAYAGALQAEAIPPNNYWLPCPKGLTVAANATGVLTDSLALGLQPLFQCPRMEVSLSAPFLRRCFESQLVVDYCNTGTLPAANATVVVTLDPFLVFESADLPLLAQNGQQLTFQIGDVAVNHCGQFNIRVTVACTAALGQEHCSTAHIYPDQDCASNWTGPWLETSATCTGPEMVLTIHNRGAAMLAPTPYTVIRSASNGTTNSQLGTVQLPADGDFTLHLPAFDGSVFLSVQQAVGFPYDTAAALIAQGCGLNDTTFFVQSYIDHYTWEAKACVANVGSYDPNDKTATPPGIGTADYLPQGQAIDYQIRFQNTGTDTAFTVVVRDDLSPWLDLTTLRPLAASQPYLLEINSQEIVFRFPKINLPHSSLNEPASHGFVRFAIQPRAGLPDGTEINNSARIYFDFNDPIITNNVHYTLGLPAVTATQTPYALPKLSVSPNPSSGAAVVELPNSVSVPFGTLNVTDVTGRSVHQQFLERGRAQFDLPQLASGVYLLSVRTRDGRTMAVGKWVKR